MTELTMFWWDSGVVVIGAAATLVMAPEDAVVILKEMVADGCQLTWNYTFQLVVVTRNDDTPVRLTLNLNRLCPVVPMEE